NGVGKSTVLEALELLRRLASPQFLAEFQSVHGGFPALLRQGRGELRVGVTVNDVEGPLRYDVALNRDGERLMVAHEDLTLHNDSKLPHPLRIIERTAAQTKMFDQAQKKQVPIEIPASALLLSSFGLHPPQDAIRRMVEALSRIRVHAPFDTTPAWQGR